MLVWVQIQFYCPHTVKHNFLQSDRRETQSHNNHQTSTTMTYCSKYAPTGNTLKHVKMFRLINSSYSLKKLPVDLNTGNEISLRRSLNQPQTQEFQVKCWNICGNDAPRIHVTYINTHVPPKLETHTHNPTVNIAPCKKKKKKIRANCIYVPSKHNALNHTHTHTQLRARKQHVKLTS